MTQEVNNTHALLSPSSAHRWMACPPSARLNAMFKDEKSEAAAEGSLAHRIAEIGLRKFNTTMSIDDAVQALKDARTSEYYDADMVSYVGAYWAYVIENARGRMIHVEERVDIPHVPACSGTVDAYAVVGDTLHIFDLKYGKGVKVDAEENPQLMMYALGVLQRTPEVEDVVLHIVQPRLYHFDTYTITASQLTAWGARTLRHTAIEAFTGDGEFFVGEHCRFCKARGVCRALAEACEVANDKPADLLTPAELADKLALIPTIEIWCKAVQERALYSAMEGVAIPRYKVVEGRSIRKISDEKAMLEAMERNGVDKSVVTKTTLISLTDMEKIFGKKAFAEEYGQYIYKPAGKPTLVPEDDRRESIVISDFNNINV